MASNAAMKAGSIIGVTIIVLLIDVLGLSYAVAHGLNFGSTTLALGPINLPLQWLPVIGIALVSLVGWYEVFTRIFPRRTGPSPDPLARLRLMRVIVFALAAFCCFLFIPYLLGSNWYWAKLSHLSRSIGQFRDFGNWLLGTEAQISNLDPIWQYATLQILATGAMVLVAWFFTRLPRRPKFR
jgi:hypothetical protein